MFNFSLKGFGQTSSSHDGHYHYQEIRHVKISYIPLKKCKRIMGDRVLDSAICTESPIEGVISQGKKRFYQYGHHFSHMIYQNAFD
jgi:hypothetical protein